MLKLMDVEAFAASFRKYDQLSKRWRPWGQLYPGIELLVGLGMLQVPQLPAVTTLVGAVAVLLGAMGMVSVGKAVFLRYLSALLSAQGAWVEHLNALYCALLLMGHAWMERAAS